jgi:hypothetical protein
MPVMGTDPAGAGLVVALLGPVEIGPAGGAMAPLSQPRLRVLLGLLGVADGRVVTVEALVDGVLGGLVASAGTEPARAGVPAAAAAGRTRAGEEGARLVRAGAAAGLAADLDPAPGRNPHHGTGHLRADGRALAERDGRLRGDDPLRLRG